MSQIQFPRLTRRDCERLLDCHNQLNILRSTLERASWAGGRVAAAAILQSDLLMCELFNRAERAFKRGQAPSQGESLEAGQSEPGAEIAGESGRTLPQNGEGEG